MQKKKKMKSISGYAFLTEILTSTFEIIFLFHELSLNYVLEELSNNHINI